MDYLPIFIKLRGRSSVVMGGGEIAWRKVSLLLKAGAQVTVVAPELCAELTNQLAQGAIAHRAARFTPEQLDGAQLVIAATDDEAVNRAVSEAAQARNIPVNVVDAPELCTFVVPSVVDRSPIVIAVSSGGNAPVLARMLRARLETLIPASYGRLAQLAGEFRDKVKMRFKSSQQRRIFWENVFQGPVAERVFSGQEAAARQQLEELLQGRRG